MESDAIPLNVALPTEIKIGGPNSSASRTDVLVSSRDAVPLAGVHLSFFDNFINQCEGRDKLVGLTTEQVCNQFIKPRTEPAKSLCDHLLAEGSREVARANCFISHTWQYKFLDVVDAIATHFKNNPPTNSDATVVVWFDLFSLPQNLTRADIDPEWLKTTFISAVSAMGNVLMVLQPWYEPITLTRAWCVFELYACISSGANFNATLPPEEWKDFMNGVGRPDAMQKFNALEARKSQASKPADLTAIQKAIEETVGFAALDMMVLKAIKAWMDHVTQEQVLSEGGMQRLREEGVAKVKSEGMVFPSPRVQGDMALLYEALGQFKRAEPLYVDYHRALEQANGPDHPDTLAARAKVGMMILQQLKYAEAEPILEDYVQRASRVLGQDHPDVLTYTMSLAQCYQLRQKLSAAEELLAFCYERSKRVRGEDHKDTLKVMNSYALLLGMNQKGDLALAMSLDLVERAERTLGRDDVHVFEFGSTLAMCYMAAGQYEKAEAVCMVYLGRARTVLGSSHPFTATVIQNLGLIRKTKRIVRGEDTKTVHPDDTTQESNGGDGNPPQPSMAVSGTATEENVQVIEHGHGDLDVTVTPTHRWALWQEWWYRPAKRKQTKIVVPTDDDKDVETSNEIGSSRGIMRTAELSVPVTVVPPLESFPSSLSRKNPLPKIPSQANTTATHPTARILPDRTTYTSQLLSPSNLPSNRSSVTSGHHLLHPSQTSLSSSTQNHNRERSSGSHASFRATIHKSLSDVRNFLKGTFSKSRENLFKEQHVVVDNRLRVYIGTWNMNGRLPLHDISPFLGHPTPPASTIQQPSYTNAHLIIIGTQECLSPLEKSVFLPSKTAWEDHLVKHYGSEYELVVTDTMVGLHLAVFVRRGWRGLVKGISKVVGNIGNKGGIGVGMKFSETSLLFVNSHLTAGHRRVVERNDDVWKINTELKLFGYGDEDRASPGAVDRYDFAFWFGDLNYRINGTRAIVDALLENDRVEALLPNDQLTLERHRGNVFPSFTEAPIKFRPTYKFDVAHPVSNGSPTSGSPVKAIIDIDDEEDEEEGEGSDGSGKGSGEGSRGGGGGAKGEVEGDRYDTSSKMRIPAWTDRILYKARKARGEWVVQGGGGTLSLPDGKDGVGGVDNRRVGVEWYDCCRTVCCSDHKPVVGIFVCDVVVPVWEGGEEREVGEVGWSGVKGKGKAKGKVGKWRWWH
ncbi:inositol polyphosphate 5-phosphatase [Rhizophlyctis rosea]|nr:inositol polyphosphate 5-phosphatase [Rhizophlyctis rosea]